MRPSQYSTTANALSDRILALIPDHPEIMQMTSPWDLFKVKDFKCSDLNPSMFQASWALNDAKHRYRGQQQ